VIPLTWIKLKGSYNKTQIKEYKADIKKPTNSLSVVSCHQLNNEHALD